jgi:hypothetical protein
MIAGRYDYPRLTTEMVRLAPIYAAAYPLEAEWGRDLQHAALAIWPPVRGKYQQKADNWREQDPGEEITPGAELTTPPEISHYRRDEDIEKHGQDNK